MQSVKIVFPEYENETIRLAVKRASGKYGTRFEAYPAKTLDEACEMVKSGVVDTMIAGIDFSSRDVILATRNIIGASAKTFSASFVLEKNDEIYVVGDAAACKNPDAGMLIDIILQTYDTAKKVFDAKNKDYAISKNWTKDQYEEWLKTPSLKPTEKNYREDEENRTDREERIYSSQSDQTRSPLVPNVAVLSFSTLGSGGKDPSIEKNNQAVSEVKTGFPWINIDGELQLDAAIVPEVGHKKAPNSTVAGRANVLIVPDLNSGNILYKSMEYFGGFTAAGPLLQGFNAPVSDLSRGSSLDDVLSVIDITIMRVEESRKEQK